MSRTAPSTSPASTPCSSSRAGWRGWLKRAGVVLAVLLVIAGTGLWVVTRSWFIVSRVQPELVKRLGGNVSIGHASYLGSGQFLFSDVLVEARGIDGPAGEVLRVDRIEIATDTASWRTGTPVITGVRIDGVRLRLSEDATAPGTFNFMSLTPEWPESDLADSRALPPEVLVSDALVQMCQHGLPGDEPFLIVGERRFAGHLEPGDGLLFDFLLAEIDAQGNHLGPAGMIAKGAWDVGTNEYHCRLDGLRLDERTFSMSPSHVREWWNRMDLSGSVSSAVIAWSPETVPELRLNVDQVGLTLPIENEGFWARFQDGVIAESPARPRLNVHAGAIVLRPDAAELVNLRGALVSGHDQAALPTVDVPYRINMSVALPPQSISGAWFDQVWTQAAFDLDFRLERFDMSTGREHGTMPAVDLPKVVADVLRRFEMRQWILETEVRISRAGPVQGPDGTLIPQPILSSGRAIIDEATCAYDQFPYPLSDVSATIHFDTTSLEIVSLSGRSSNGNTIRLTGRITPLDRTAGTDLRLTGAGIAVDDVLRNALPEQSRQAFDAVFDQAACERARVQGALTTQADIDAARAQRRMVLNAIEQIDEGAADPQQLAELQRLRDEAARLDRVVNAGPFELGGAVDLDLRILREIGRGKPTRIEGQMVIQQVGIMYERFPYPMTIHSGTVHWSHESVGIGSEQDPLLFTTPGGGNGAVWGKVDLAYRPTRVSPDLHFDVVGDRLSPAVFSAIPKSRDQQVQIADVLQSMRLDATLNYQGRVETKADGKATYDFVIAATGGEAKPDAQITEMVGLTGLYWPESLTLHEVSGLLHVRPGGVEIEHVTATHSGGTIRATGSIGDASSPTDLTVNFESMPVDAYLIDLAPSEGVDRLREIWKRYQPAGQFDAFIHYSNTEQGAHPVLQFEPRDITVQTDDGALTISRESGAIAIEAGSVSFDGLTLHLHAEDRDDGRIVLQGSYGPSASGSDLHFSGVWLGGRFESPAVPEVMFLAEVSTLADRYRGFAPSGAFDAVFVYESSAASADPTFEIELYPDRLELLVSERPVTANFSDDTLIVLQPGMVEFIKGAGVLNGRNRFEAAGTLTFNAVWDQLSLGFSFDGFVGDEQVQAILPEAVRDAMAALEITEAEPCAARDCQLQLWNRRADGTAEEPSIDAEFVGMISVRDAAMIAGVPFEGIAATLEVDYRSFHNAPELTIDVAVETMDVLGQRVTNATTLLELNADDEQIIVHRARGDCYGGAVAAEARVGVEENREYDLTVDIVGVGLAKMFETAAAADAHDGAVASDGQIGQLYGKLVMAGERGAVPSDARGRGSVRIIDAALARMPITLRVIQLMEFMPPLSESFNYADASFYVSGERLVFEEILLECPTLQLVGTGDMVMETMEVDWLLRTRGTLTLLRELVGGVSNTLYGIRVSGPLKDPSAELVPIPVMAEPSGGRQRSAESGLADASEITVGDK